MEKARAKVTIPADLDFNDLGLTSDPDTGDVKFVWEPIERLCVINNIDLAYFRGGPSCNLFKLLGQWYFAHLGLGGVTNPIMEELIVEALYNNEHGRWHQD